MSSKEKKVAIVTGASRGIGKEVAYVLGREGMSLVLNFRQSLLETHEFLVELNQMGISAIAVQADISERSQVQHLLDTAVDRYDKIDVLVNNAGLNMNADLFEITDDLWNKVVDVNLKGTFLCSQLIGQFMYARRSGHIINIASTAGIKPAAYSHHYVAAKSGVIGFSRALALSLAPYVNVNVVAPGYVNTEVRQKQDSKALENRLSKIPLKRFAEMSEIANVVRFLACDGTYITGQVLAVDGGLTLNPY